MRFGLKIPPPEARPFDFVAVGEGGVDVISVVDGVPQFDGKTKASSRQVLPGGQAASAAVGVSRLGLRARWVGVTGDDDWGRLLRNALQRERVDVRAPIRSTCATRSAVVLVERTSRSRAVVEHRNSALDAAPDDFDEDTQRSGRIILVDGTDIDLSVRAATAARTAGSATMVDLDHAHPRAMDLLQQIDVVILPDKLVRELTDGRTVGDGLRRLAAELQGATAIVATMGPDGAVGLCEGREARVPAFPVEAVDTTGAGDAFRAGFAARWLSAAGPHADFLDLLEYAALVAGLSCRALGAQTGLPTASEVEAAWCNRPSANWV